MQGESISDEVVVIGGGSGTYTILRGLQGVIGEGLLTSIHTMSDSGGSSRRLMDEFGRTLPMGDLRQGLVAQSRNRRLWRDLFAYRFSGSTMENGLSGHSLGNLILHALEEINGGGVVEALSDAEYMLNTVGWVVPVTLDQATLCAELMDGRVICGEHEIDVPQEESRAPIRRVYLTPQPQITGRARKALERATRIILGPGDLYTSVLPNLLVAGTREAIRGSDAEIIYIVNLMTKAGETDGYRASDFVREIAHYLGRRPDTVVVHTAAHRSDLLAHYLTAGTAPVVPDVEMVARYCGRVLTGSFASEETLIRHDADKVIAALWSDIAVGGNIQMARAVTRMPKRAVFPVSSESSLRDPQMITAPRSPIAQTGD